MPFAVVFDNGVCQGDSKAVFEIDFPWCAIPIVDESFCNCRCFPDRCVVSDSEFQSITITIRQQIIIMYRFAGIVFNDSARAILVIGFVRSS
ncbi:hypothetical protein [Bacteroides acidifaciens]|uniref:hypothetical protein n=1 Tax=Bacteroides acidifaciens TaxID=85831 RepID=UPI00255837DC|nr:hypothetical protein [Bacteroides acidifaciens]